MATSAGSASIVLSVNAEGVSQGLNLASGKMNDWRQKWAGISDKLPPLKPEVIPDTSKAKKADEEVRGFFRKPITLSFISGGALDKAAGISIGAQSTRALAGIATAISDAAQGTGSGWDVLAESLTKLPLGIGPAVEAMGRLYVSLGGSTGRTAELVKQKERLVQQAAAAREKLEQETKAMEQHTDAMRKTSDAYADLSSIRGRIAGMMALHSGTFAGEAESERIAIQAERMEKLSAVEKEIAENRAKLERGDITKSDAARFEQVGRQRAAAIRTEYDLKQQVADEQAAERQRAYFREAEQYQRDLEADFTTRKQKEVDAQREAESKIRQLHLQSIGQREEAEKEAIKERYRKEIEAATDPKLRDRLNILQTLELNAVGRESSKVGFRASEVQVQSLDVAFTKSSSAVKTAPNKIEGLTEQQNQYLRDIRDSIKNGVTARAA